MKKIILFFAAAALVTASYAQEYKEMYRKAINTTCYLDSIVCEGIVSAHKKPTQQECLQELAQLYSKVTIMVDIAKECDKTALQHYTTATYEDIVSGIEWAIYSRQVLARFCERIEKIETIIKVNQYNKAKWSADLRYRNDYIEEFSKEAKKSGALKK